MADRKQGLDLLRAIAIILVLFHHFGIVIDATDLKKAWFYPIVMGGWVGVDLFFVLSGFLVSGLLIKEKIKYQQIKYGRFLIRRLLKIYPAYYFFTIITLSVWYISGAKKLPISNVLGELFFIQNYTGPLWRHTWSLAVEEHFYLLLCLIMPWLLQTKKRC